MNIYERIQQYWDNRSQAFNDVRLRELTANAEAWHTFLQKYISPDKPLRILDVGTGPGFFPILLHRDGHKLTGIDLSPNMVRYAKENATHFDCSAEFCQMNAQDLALADESFDLIISRHLTWTLPDVAGAYREWLRVLKPNGRILNIDADYGKTVFANGKEEHFVHAHIAAPLLEECTNIKNSLIVSRHRRPQWDRELLEDLGATVTIWEDIRPHIQVDGGLVYDQTPLFLLEARKAPH